MLVLNIGADLKKKKTTFPRTHRDDVCVFTALLRNRSRVYLERLSEQSVI